jgi:hypothetical protein
MPLLRAATSGRHRNPMLAGWLADALYRTGDTAGAEQVAADALPDAIDPDVLVDLYWTLAQCLAVQGRSAECVETLETALATTSTPPGCSPPTRSPRRRPSATARPPGGRWPCSPWCR